MSITALILSEAAFRFCFASGLTFLVIPGELLPRVPQRCLLSALACLSLLNGVLLYQQSGKSEHSLLLLVMALLIAGSCLVAAIALPRQPSRRESEVYFAVGLVGLMAASLGCRWAPATTGWGIGLGILDLLSSGMIFACLASITYLGLMYLHTPKMQQIPAQLLTRGLAAAVAIRVVLALAVIAAWSLGAAELSGLLATFLILRCILACIGLWLLVVVAKDVQHPSGVGSSTPAALLGLLIAAIGEAASHLVVLSQIYPF